MAGPQEGCMTVVFQPRECHRPALAMALAVSIILVGHDLASAQSPSRSWVDEHRAAGFVCRAAFSLDAYQGLFGELGELQDSVTRLLHLAPSGQPIELYLFADKPSYDQFLRARMPQVSHRRALFVKGAGPGRVFVYRSNQLDIDVRHESTHALLHASLPMVPLWLDEGLAEYFELPGKERPFRQDYLAKLKSSIRRGTFPRLDRLEAKRELAELTEVDYRDAWAWVHFMLHGPERASEELVAFLADIRAHTPPGRLSARLEARLPGVEQRLIEHFKSWSIPGIQTPRRR